MGLTLFIHWHMHTSISCALRGLHVPYLSNPAGKSAYSQRFSQPDTSHQTAPLVISIMTHWHSHTLQHTESLHLCPVSASFNSAHCFIGPLHNFEKNVLVLNSFSHGWFPSACICCWHLKTARASSPSQILPGMCCSSSTAVLIFCRLSCRTDSIEDNHRVY